MNNAFNSVGNLQLTTMAIPREFFQQLNDAANIAEIIGETVALKKQGRNMVGLCPFHAEKTPSFTVNTEKGFYHCFGCGANGNALNFMVHQNGGDFIAGVEALAARLGMSIPRQQSGREPAVGFYDALKDAAAHWRLRLHSNETAQKYLHERGLNEDTAKHFHIGYAATEWHDLEAALGSKYDHKTLIKVGLLRDKDKRVYDYFRHRLMFPIMERDGRICGFGGRALGDDPPKYLNSPDSPVFTKNQTVFGLAQARAAARKKNRIIITEGYMDTVMLSQAGFPEAVATMGTAATVKQMEKIIRAADNVIFAFDGDDAGRTAAWRGMENILPALRDGAGVSFLFLPQGEDPDSFVRARGAKSFAQLLTGAESLADYLVRQLWESAAVDSKEGRDSAALQAGGKLLKLINPARAPYLQALLNQRLAQQAKISLQTMRRAVAKPRPADKARFKMQNASPLLNFLSCFAARPDLIDSLQDNPPLPGAPAEAEITAAVLNYFRWHPDSGEADIPAYLESEGYTALATQVRGNIERRYGVAQKSPAGDVKKDFDLLLERLLRKHSSHTGAGRKKWLNTIRQQAQIN